LEVLSRIPKGFYELVVPHEDLRKAYYALQHILRGKKFERARDLLNRGEVYDFSREVERLADELKDFGKYYSKKGGKEPTKYYGSCEICGTKLSEREKEALRKWCEKLGLRAII